MDDVIAPGLDAALPWGGLPQGALHEVIAADEPAAAAATGFCTALLAALVSTSSGHAAVLWGARDAMLYGPALAAFGLDPTKLIIARVRRSRDVLWVMEEGLRSAQLGAVLGEIDDISLFASRRLQLAAETSGVTAFLLRKGALAPLDRLPPCAAVTRWRVRPAPGNGLARPTWQLELLRCRGGLPRSWTVAYRQNKRM